SLLGIGQADPVGRTAGNFARATLVGCVLLPVIILGSGEFDIGWRGAALAVISGAITSGLGYVIWYAALRSLTATRAGVAQLTVPVIAAGGGVLIGEALTLRFTLAAVLILTGVALASFAKARPSA
ncbi:MAG: DMT family transporter, partial [Pseudomonadota bacterium]